MDSVIIIKQYGIKGPYNYVGNQVWHTEPYTQTFFNHVMSVTASSLVLQYKFQ